MDETIQAVVPGRESLVTDVWIDTLGAVIGIIILSIILKWKQHSK